MRPAGERVEQRNLCGPDWSCLNVEFNYLYPVGKRLQHGLKATNNQLVVIDESNGNRASFDSRAPSIVVPRAARYQQISARELISKVLAA